MNDAPHPVATGHLTCIAAMVVVGASLATSAVLVDYPIFGGQAVRYAVAGVILLAVVGWRRVPLRRPTAREALLLLVLAATGLAFFNVCVIQANARLDPSLVGAVVGTAPLALAVAGGAARRGSRRLLAAAVLVVAGVVMVQGLGALDGPGLCWAIGALAGEVAFSMLAVPVLPTLGPLLVSTYVCWIAVPLMLLVGLVLPGPLFAVPTVSEAASLGYLAVMVTAVAFLLWYGGLSRIGPARASLYCAVMPVAAAATSVVLGLEPLRLHVVLGSAVVAGGLAVGAVRRRPDRQRTSHSTEGHPVTA